MQRSEAHMARTRLSRGHKGSYRVRIRLSQEACKGTGGAGKGSLQGEGGPTHRPRDSKKRDRACKPSRALAGPQTLSAGAAWSLVRSARAYRMESRRGADSPSASSKATNGRSSNCACDESLSMSRKHGTAGAQCQ